MNHFSCTPHFFSRLHCLLAALFFLLASGSVEVLRAQEGGKISGVIRDAATNEPLPGANILVKGTTQGSASEFDGTYFILNVAPGVYEVVAKMVGYQSVTVQRVIVYSNRTVTVDIRLRQITVDIGQDVVVTAERPDVQKEKTSTSDIIRSDEVLAVPGIRDLVDVLSMSSDVSDSHFRGGREGEELYNLQGMGIVNPLSNSTSFAPIMSAVEEVEVITSGFSAQYGNAQSGVVNISMKEGRTDKWEARAELRTRAPGRKHFGPSVWDVNANPYLTILNNASKWSDFDTMSTGGGKYYTSVGNGFGGHYGQDSVTLGQIAYTYWGKQAKRDIGMTYDNLRDYSMDATAGGPVSDDARVFLALHSEHTWPILPTPEPNQKKQFMGNVVFDAGSGMTLRLSGAYSNEREANFGGSSTDGFYAWVWDRTLSTSRTITDNYQIGTRFTYASSSRTFYEMKVNFLRNDLAGGSPVVDPVIYSGNYGKTMWFDYGSTPDNFSYGKFDDDFRSERSRTITADGSVTSQVTNSHMLLAGIQANWYQLDVNSTLSLTSLSGSRFENYTAKPMEYALYVQDKMEFEGMIANIGLRLDIYNQNVSYYTDQYAPYRYINANGDTLTDKALANVSETPTLARLQPRLGISFPVSTSTVFHVNYGAFVQRPPFNQTAYQQVPTSGFKDIMLGNPRLKPQVTNSYDIGVTQALGEGFTVDLSGYYKDVRNLIQQAFYFDIQGYGYSTFANRDYADIRGFRVGLSRRRGMLTGSLNYTYGVATGKNSNPFNESPKFFESGIDIPPTAKDVLLDFDRTHNVVASLVFKTDEEWGPVIMDVAPLANVSVSATSFIRSGRPYTYDTQGLGELFNRRTPTERNTNVKITKQISEFFGTRASVYLEIFNLFDDRIYNYNAVFRKSRNNVTGEIRDNRNLVKYESDLATGQNTLQYYETVAYPDLKVDQTFVIYGNAPRSYQFGIVLNF